MRTERIFRDMATPLESLAAALSGRYSIEGEIGEGGMATVYRAEDLKHSRSVAIKVLKPDLAAVIGAERFLKEIETTAGLQHPHILSLFDSGQANGFLYYVMPYVEGETVRDRLDRETQLGVREATSIAADVADALDYAHRQGVIHRDIKPANILLQDGRPVVADFGIALAVSAAGGGRLTETGLSLGTPWYMSPEQATADRALTPRSDVYALGAVLYEMLAGEPPHTGPTGQTVVAKILTEEAPSVRQARKSVPPNVAAATRKALEKLPADRFESAKAFAEALRDPAFRYDADPASASRPAVFRSGPRTPLLGWLVAAALAVGLLWVATMGEPPGQAPAIAVEIGVLGQSWSDLAVTDDGTIVSSLRNQIRIRSPDSLSFRTLHTDRRTVTGVAPSPDGRWIAFTTFGDAGAGMYRIPRSGGDVVTLLDSPGARAPLWGQDGWIYFGLEGTGVVRIPEEGGPVETLLEASHVPGDLIDGGRALLLGNGVLVLDLATGDTVRLVPEAERARWSPTGHILYTHDSGAMFALPFSAEDRAATGPARAVIHGVSASASEFDLSDTGILVYQAGSSAPNWGRSDYWWVGTDGEWRRIPIEEVAGHTDAELSPDGRRIAYIREFNLHVFDLDLGTDRSLGPAAHDPVWSMDGLEIAFRGYGGLSVVRADGSGEPRRVGSLDATSPTQWLPDGTLLLATFVGDVLAIDSRGGPEARPRDVLVASWHERSPTISPDGRWIAYNSDEDGAPRAYVRTWPGLGARTLVSGADSLWGYAETLHWEDSRHLLYVRSDRTVVEASLDFSDGVAVTDRRAVVDLGTAGPQDLDIQGDRFLVTRSTVGGEDPNALPEPNRIVLVTNWLGELRRRLAEAR